MNINKLNIIFNNSECISTDEMISFLNGNLTEKENNRIEKHLLVCEMCKDEINGIKEFGDINRIDNIVLELNKKIDKRIENKVRKIVFLKKNYFQIAAAILILISSTFFINNFINNSVKDMQASESVSQNIYEETVEEEEIEDNFTDEEFAEEKTQAPVEKEFKKKINKNREAEFKAIKAISDSEITENKIETSVEENLDTKEDLEEEVVENNVDNFSEIAYNNAVVFDENDKTNRNKSYNNNISSGKTTSEDVAEKKIKKETAFSNRRLSKEKIQKENKNKKTDSKIVSEPKTDLYFKKGLNSYYKNDYETAKKYFKQSLNLNNNANSNYYLALTFIKLNDNKKAIKYFNNVLKYKNSNYLEEALWQKTIVLLKENKKNKATDLLKNIFQDKGKYSKQAKIKLDSLKVD